MRPRIFVNILRKNIYIIWKTIYIINEECVFLRIN